MSVRASLPLLCAGFILVTPAQGQVAPREAAEWNVPQWASSHLRAAGAQRGFGLYLGVNPFYLQGDFDGDGQLDLAVLIERHTDHKRGIAFVHHADLSIHIVGAGQALGNGGDDFSWLLQWFVQDRSALSDAHVRGRQLLYVGNGEGVGGLIWWNGTRYAWTQRGD